MEGHWMVEWYRVSDGWFPTAGVNVLVCTRSKNGTRNIDKGYRTEDGRWVHRGNAEVTHWTYLPEFPEDRW